MRIAALLLAASTALSPAEAATTVPGPAPARSADPATAAPSASPGANVPPSPDPAPAASRSPAAAGLGPPGGVAATPPPLPLTSAKCAVPAGDLDAKANAATPAFVTLNLNSNNQDGVLALIGPDEIWLKEADLVAGGAKTVSALAHAKVNGDSFFALSSLCGSARYAYVESKSTLHLYLDAASYAHQGIAAADNSQVIIPPYTRQREVSMFYDLSESSAGTFFDTVFSASALGGVARLNGLLGGKGGPAFGQANITYYNPARLNGLTLGQVNASGGEGAGNASFIGAALQSHPELDPFRPLRPQPTIFGVSQGVSHADLYIDGRVVRQFTIDPGPFTIQNLPIAAGQAGATLVLKDTLGERVYDSSYPYEGDLLSRGTNQYSYAAGQFQRDASLGARGGSLGFIGRERVGVSDATTLGLRAEAAAGTLDEGFSVDTSNRVGGFHLVAARSTQRGLTGSYGGFGFSRALLGATMGFTEGSYSKNYANLSLDAAGDRRIVDQQGFVRRSVGRVSLGLVGTRTLYRDNGATSVLTLQASAPVARSGVDLSLNVQRGTTRQADGTSGKTTAIYVGATMQLRARFSAAAQGTNGPQRGLTITRQGNPDGGLSASGSLNQGGLSFSGQEKTQYGEVNFSRTSTNGSAATTLDVTGSVLSVGGLVMFAPPISDAFIVVDAGYPKIPVVENGSTIGTTRKAGYLVIPTSGNIPARVSLSLIGAPENVDVARGDVNVRVFSGTGALVRRRAQKIHAVTAHLIFPNGKRPEYGTVAGFRPGFPPAKGLMGGEGVIFFEDLAAGEWSFVATYPDGSCSGKVASPPTGPPDTDVGDTPCAVVSGKLGTGADPAPAPPPSPNPSAAPGIPAKAGAAARKPKPARASRRGAAPQRGRERTRPSGTFGTARHPSLDDLTKQVLRTSPAPIAAPSSPPSPAPSPAQSARPGPG